MNLAADRFVCCIIMFMSSEPVSVCAGVSVYMNRKNLHAVGFPQYPHLFSVMSVKTCLR